ncbi:MAG: ATP synthase F1 subunit gamma [Deltaproteobacteria bacterium]|nr:ATP synthase F1 subunit gamma [Deltaproteobacteria bacterium]
MATLRDLRTRLRAVKNTGKITKAMKMVSASKLRRAQDAILQARPYAIRMDEVLQHIVEHSDVSAHPLLACRAPRRVMLIVLSSNRGLCGSFNANIIRSAERFLRDGKSKYEDVRVGTIGRKARDHFRRVGVELDATYEGVWESLDFEHATEIAEDVATRFKRGELDAIYLLYNEFKSAISQNVSLVELLPIRRLQTWDDAPRVRIGELAAVSGNVGAVAGHKADLDTIQAGQSWHPAESVAVSTEGYEHIFEPSRKDVLNHLLPQHLAVQIWRALLESTAAEHGARMSAMDAASRNAKEMMERLTLNVNRARQAAITRELMEIVGGAEALKS